jgi:hypothetical protein
MICNLFYNSTSSSATNSSFPRVLDDLLDILTIWYRAFIILFGIVGNSLTILIFLRTKQKHSLRTSYYLTRLAVSDICFLLMLSIRYVNEVDSEWFFYLDWYNTQPWVCKVSTYLSQIFTFISCVYVLAFTAHRMCVICFPFSITEHRVKRWSKILISSSFVFGFTFYSVLLFFYNVVDDADELGNSTNSTNTSLRKYCSGEKRHQTILDYFNWVDSLFTFIIPFFGMIIMNTMMIRTLRNSNINFIIRTSSNNQNV